MEKLLINVGYKKEKADIKHAGQDLEHEAVCVQNVTVGMDIK